MRSKVILSIYKNFNFEAKGVAGVGGTDIIQHSSK